jgi:hypothetical protein
MHAATADTHATERRIGPFCVGKETLRGPFLDQFSSQYSNITNAHGGVE